MKISRNSPCYCGSGKKYKKCCLIKPSSESIQVQKEIDMQLDNDDVMFNSTGELFHPVRLHYKINDAKKMKDVFKSLKCIEYDDVNKRYVWLFQNEVKDLELPEKCNQLAPVVLGSFFISKHNENEIVFDIRSMERVLFAVPFFDKCIGRDGIELTDVSLPYNFITENTKSITSNFDKYYPLDHAKEEIAQRLNDLPALQKGIDVFSNKKFPDTDKLEIFYDDDGISMLKTALTISLLVAGKRREGYKNVTLKDIMRDIPT